MEESVAHLEVVLILEITEKLKNTASKTLNESVLVRKFLKTLKS